MDARAAFKVRRVQLSDLSLQSWRRVAPKRLVGLLMDSKMSEPLGGKNR